MIHIKSIELEGNARVSVVNHMRRMRLIKGIFIQVNVVVGIMLNHYSIDGWNSRREIGRSFAGLSIVRFYNKQRMHDKKQKSTQRSNYSRVSHQC